jgi:phosphatidylserine/phosphatidylglycerophosphate/cardiolipin synthase-like enzyme
LKALVAAAGREVRVKIITPGEHMDAETVRRASRAQWGQLLQAGVEIFEYQPTMYHCKVMIVDDLWLSVGSTNFDNRSFSLNDEANLNITDKTLAPAAGRNLSTGCRPVESDNVYRMAATALGRESYRTLGIATANAAVSAADPGGLPFGTRFAYGR